MRFIEKALDVAAKRDLKQVNLARAAGVEPARVSEWKKGEGKPSLEQAFRIARLLGVALDWLADEESEEIPITMAFTEAERQALIMTRSLGLTLDQVVRGLSAVVGSTRPTAHPSPFGEQDSRVVEGHPLPLPPGLKTPDGPRRPGRGGAASA